jgi:hypothetical protein
LNHFRGTCCLQLQVSRAAGSSDMLVLFYQNKSITSQKKVLFTVTAARPSNLTFTITFTLKLKRILLKMFPLSSEIH